MQRVLMLCALTLMAPATVAAQATNQAATIAAQEEAIKPLPPGRVEVYLEDLHCKTCAKKVSRKLYALRGVSKVETYLQTDKVVIHTPKDRPVATASIWQAVLAGGVKPIEIRFADQQLDSEAMEEVLRQASLEHKSS